MATQPAFATVPRIGSAQVSAANTNRDGTGTIVTVITGVAAGTRIAEVVVEATVTTTAGMVRLYLFDGTNTRLFDEVAIAAATPSASVKTTRVSTVYTNLILPSASWQLRASTHNAEAINVIALGADL
jgi:hypothetical protein